MSNNDWNGMLTAAAGEVLETMFFAAVNGPGEPHPPAGPRVAARLSFEGTPSGALTVSVTEPALRYLAANFLAEDEMSPLPDGQLGSVVGELANMICGSMLSHVRTEEHFKLSSPEALSENAVWPSGPPTQSLALDEGAGEGTIDLWLTLEPHAG